MAQAIVEHVNLTVSDPQKTADFLCRLLDWKIRWEGEALQGGYTVHVGSDDSYLALYTHNKTKSSNESSYTSVAGLNHIGIVVDDLDDTEKRVIELGFTPENHGDYEPGRRFYMHDGDNIEYEFVSYRQ